METKLNKALAIANEVERTGVGFFSRSKDDMHIWIRGAHGNDPNQWYNANKVLFALGLAAKSGIVPDPMSGHLIITVSDIYK